MERKLSDDLIKLITKIDTGLAKASPREVVTVDWLSEEDADSLYLKYSDQAKEEGSYKLKYEVLRGQIINGKTSDSSYCLHIRRKD